MECGERARGIAVGGPPTPECLTPVFRWWLRMGRNISLYVLLSVLHNLCDVDEVRRTDVFSDKVHFGAEGDVNARRLCIAPALYASRARNTARVFGYLRTSTWAGAAQHISIVFKVHKYTAKPE